MTKSNNGTARRTALVFCLAGMGLVAFSDLAVATSWKGKWGGVISSTLQFLDGKRVKYCYGVIDCIVTGYSGDEKGTVSFSSGHARFQFKWNGSGYNGTYEYGLNYGTIVMTKAPD